MAQDVFSELFDGAIALSPEGDSGQAVRDIPPGAGLCLVTDSENRPILLISGGSIREIIQRRLDDQSPQKKFGVVKLRSIAGRVWYKRCWSAFESQWRYFEAARVVYPDRYREFFGYFETWLLGADLTAPYPSFFVTESGDKSGCRYWGPFASKKAATTCLEVLEDMFLMCRKPGRLAVAPHQSACSYAQMGRCVPVCDGRVSQTDYRSLIDQAIAFLDQPFGQTAAQLERDMKNLSQSLQFEQAAQVKYKLDRVEKLTGPLYRWVAPWDRFYILGFQPGPPIRQPGRGRPVKSVAVFFIHPAGVAALPSIPLNEVQPGLAEVLKQGQAFRQGEPRAVEAKQRETAVWAAQFLYRKHKGESLYYRLDDSLNVSSLAELISTHFSAKKREAANSLSPDSGQQIEIEQHEIS